jgi:hypothetical protein
MQWTKERPTQAGAYWASISNESPDLVLIQEHLIDGVSQLNTYPYFIYIADAMWDSYQWLGPIEVPAPPKDAP